MQIETSKNKPTVFVGVSHFFWGIALVVLPLVWAFFMYKNTVSIAKSPAAAWWVELWVLIGAVWLLFAKKADHQKRLVVEVSTVMAAVLIFATKLILGAH